MFDNGIMKCVASISTRSRLYRRWYAALPDHARLCWDIMITTGLRLSDALTLTVEECRAGYKIEHKTGQRRRIRYTPPAWCRAGLILSNRAGMPYHRTTMEKIYKRHRDELGISVPLNAHSARKIYAMQLLDRSNDITAVQRDLGHKYLSTTLVYLFAHPHIDEYGRIVKDGRFY